MPGLTRTYDDVQTLPQVHQTRDPDKPALLAFCYEFPPQTTPTANRSAELLRRLSAHWKITVLTPTGCNRLHGLEALQVTPRLTGQSRRLLKRARLDKLVDWLPLPEDHVGWADAATAAALRFCETAARPDLLLAFMYPYASGNACLKVQARTGIPAVFNFDDTPSCDDMHPSYPSRIHFARTLAWEDRIIRAAAAVIYVSQRNLDRVRQRQRPCDRRKLHLVRYGVAEFGHASLPRPNLAGPWELLYSGNMSGWAEFFDPPGCTPVLKKALAAWNRFGQHTRTRHDHKGSSPYYLAQAFRQFEARASEPPSGFRLRLIGNLYPQSMIGRALIHGGMAERVRVEGPVEYPQSLNQLARADVLFMCLPTRVDGSAGGRISAKTYEYLATDRPILAALPRGENREYLKGQPGVWVTEPQDVDGMAQALWEIASSIRAAGGWARFDRRHLLAELGYAERARQFEAVLHAARAANGA